MKKFLLIFICLPIIGFGQNWSNYYIDANVKHDINANVNINKNVNVSGTVNKNVKVTNSQTITTIDYGQLALANAQKEKNRLENLQYSDARAQKIALEIASNPIKAYDYGYKRQFETKTNKKSGEAYKYTGFKQFSMSYVVPHSSIFTPAGAGRFENVSEDMITTEFNISAPIYNLKNGSVWTETNALNYKELSEESKEKAEEYASDFLPIFIWSPELQAKGLNWEVGKLNAAGNDSIFVHKKDINRATVWGSKGFVGTFIYEDEYQFCITDNYHSINTKDNGIYNFVKVRYYGDKDEITFEELEGRRFYLKRLVEKVISTAFIYDAKYLKK